MMLRFAKPLTPAAHALVVYSLEVAADDLLDLFDDEGWAANFPRSAACFTRELAHRVLTDMREKLDQTELYMPTDYQWLLLYEALQVYVSVANDNQPDDLMNELRTLAQADDAAYVDFSRVRRRKHRVAIDLDAFLDEFFWDTDFLLEPDVHDELGAEQKQQLGITPELFGVIHRLSPHPDELILRPLSAPDAKASMDDDVSKVDETSP
jgi:hypothetical protein